MSEVQRVRVLAAMTDVVCERGLESTTVAHVVTRAGVSRRTFYDLFADRHECFLAAFEEALACAADTVGTAYSERGRWIDRVRAGLFALLGLLDDRPELARLCVVQALAAGPVVLERRAEVLRVLTEAVDQGRLEKRGEGAPSLTAEGLVGAVFAVIHARLLEADPARLVDLGGSLMEMIALPYLGAAAARRELGRPAPRISQGSPTRAEPQVRDPLAGLDMRVTYRTIRVLSVIAGHPGVSNREIAREAGVSDQGQISKLLTRLQRLALIHNSGPGHTRGATNAWHLTPRGVELHRSLLPHRGPSPDPVI